MHHTASCGAGHSQSARRFPCFLTKSGLIRTFRQQYPASNEFLVLNALKLTNSIPPCQICTRSERADGRGAVAVDAAKQLGAVQERARILGAGATPLRRVGGGDQRVPATASRGCLVLSAARCPRHIPNNAVAKEQKAYVVESYPGGIGIAKKILERWRSVLRVGVDIAVSCTCAAGCPNCIVPPRSMDDIDKVGAMEFAEGMLEATTGEATGVFRGGLWVPVTATWSAQ